MPTMLTTNVVFTARVSHFCFGHQHFKRLVMWLQLTMIALRAGIRDNFAMIVQNSFKSVFAAV